MKLEKASLIGIILAFGALGIGIVLKGVNITALWNPAALLIIFGGTIASVFIAFPMKQLKKVPTLLKIIFTNRDNYSLQDIIALFTEWSVISRREGLLALETVSEDHPDPFIRQAMRSVIEGRDPEFVKQMLVEDIDAMEQRHKSNALIFTQAGTYAPTLGVLGAVVGLIAALGSLDDIEKLGHSIAAAFIATLLGIFTGYVLWHPFANKLKQLSKDEALIKTMIAEGVLSVQQGDSPAAITDKLLIYVPLSERAKVLEKLQQAKENRNE